MPYKKPSSAEELVVTRARNAEKSRKYREKNREKVLKEKREYWGKNKDWVNKKRLNAKRGEPNDDDGGIGARKKERDLKWKAMAANKVKHGKTKAERDAIWESQGSACKICRKKKPDQTEHVDHDHYDGKFRGLLCRECNLLLGYAQDKPSILLSAAKYLEQTVAYDCNENKLKNNDLVVVPCVVIEFNEETGEVVLETVAGKIEDRKRFKSHFMHGIRANVGDNQNFGVLKDGDTVRLI